MKNAGAEQTAGGSQENEIRTRLNELRELFNPDSYYTPDITYSLLR